MAVRVFQIQFSLCENTDYTARKTGFFIALLGFFDSEVDFRARSRYFCILASPILITYNIPYNIMKIHFKIGIS